VVLKICGIVGVFNAVNAPLQTLDFIVEQQNRGRDGTGIGFLLRNQCFILKKSIEPSEYEKLFKEKIKTFSAKIAIGHNRAATCNHPEKRDDKESHPFLSEDRKFMLVHNGTVRDHESIRKILTAVNDHNFSSGVDSEIFVHILEEFLHKSKSREEALRRFYGVSSGNIIILFSDGEMIGIPEGSFYLLVVGRKVYIASEMSTFSDFLSTIKENCKLYVPKTYSGSMVSIKMEGKYPIIKLIGEWKTAQVLSKDGWFATNHVICDFCKTTK